MLSNVLSKSSLYIIKITRTVRLFSAVQLLKVMQLQLQARVSSTAFIFSLSSWPLILPFVNLPIALFVTQTHHLGSKNEALYSSVI